MNAKETMEALLAGRTVRPTRGKFSAIRTLTLDPEGDLMIGNASGKIENCPLILVLNCECEAVEPVSSAEEALKTLLAGGRVRQGDMTYWLDGDMLRRQWRDDAPCCIIDLSACTAEARE